MKLRSAIASIGIGICLLANESGAQTGERTIEEVKAESLVRAERGAYPLGGIDMQDAREALGAIKSRDADEWAAAWSAVAARYMAMADSAKDPKSASAIYRRAWRLYYMAQWPAPTSAGKQRASELALQAYLKYARDFDPPLQVVKIPFEGKEIVGYLRMPKNASGPMPLILAINGLDSRKETVADGYAQILERGVGFFAVDGPGTGQAPIKVSENAERMFSRVIDYLIQRPDVDKSRIIVSGVSFGGYWATKLAIIEKARILGSVAQSPAVHEYFSSQRQYARQFNREYLFDYVPAAMHIFDNVTTLDALAARTPDMSLQKQGLLQKPTAPMLIVAGVKDTQVPHSDVELLMRSGDVPKEFWINPQGGHLGREAKGWTDPVILAKVIIPWELRLLEQSGYKLWPATVK
jgi:dipeptidyl aminopeptidase/acylaminoacyl peptidase